MFNNGPLFKEVLIVACCSLINLDFLLPHNAQFDCIIDLSFLLLPILGLVLLVYFLHDKQ